MEVRSVGTLGPSERQSVLDRDTGIDEIRPHGREIVTTVRTDGDDALCEFCRRSDGVEVASLDITAAA